MDKEDKVIESIVEEYKLSMGGSFFNNASEEDPNMELEKVNMENGIEDHLFDAHALLSVYDNLSEYNKREFFQKVVVAFIKFKFDTNESEKF